MATADSRTWGKPLPAELEFAEVEAAAAFAGGTVVEDNLEEDTVVGGSPEDKAAEDNPEWGTVVGGSPAFVVGDRQAWRDTHRKGDMTCRDSNRYLPPSSAEF